MHFIFLSFCLYLWIKPACVFVCLYFPLCLSFCLYFSIFFLIFVIFSFCFQHAGSLVGSGVKNHPEAFQRLIEMELRANAKPVHPAAAGNIPDMYGPELGMSFRYS